MENPVRPYNILTESDKSLSRAVYDMWILGGYTTEEIANEYHVSNEKILILIRYAHMIFRKAMKIHLNSKHELFDLHETIRDLTIQRDHAELSKDANFSALSALRLEFAEFRQKVRNGTISAEDLQQTNEKWFYKIEEIEFSVRIYNCLKNSNIIYVGELIQQSERYLLRTPGLGRKSFNEIKSALEGMGLFLGTQIEDWSILLKAYLTQKEEI